MGAAWCRERIEQAQNSKSPVDRIITRCSNAINAKTIYSKPNQSKPANDIVFRQIRYPTAVPVHKVPPPRLHQKKSWIDNKGTTWTDIPLGKENEAPPEKTPVPPPRKRKKRKVNSLEVLSSQIDMIYESRNSLKPFNEHSQLLFGDPLPIESRINLHSDSSPDRRSPTKFSDNESRRKTRAKKIMESKTRASKKDGLSLSLAREPSDINDEWFSSPRLVKNISTPSLLSFAENSSKTEQESNTKTKVDGFKRNASSISLPGDSVLTAISGVTMNRLEAYMRRCKSFGSLKPQQLLEKLEEITNKQESESSDSWSGLDDWDLGVIEYCDAESSDPPIVPKCRLSSKGGARVFELGPQSDEVSPQPAFSLQRQTSMSDDSFNKPRSVQEWSSTPSIPVEHKVKTPPPTPDDEQEVQPFSGAHSTLLEILGEPVNVTAPTPPRRRSRDLVLRRQSYHPKSEAPPMSYLMTRSYSLDTTVDEVKPNLSKTWNNLSASCSQHSLQQALENFLGYEDPPVKDANSNQSLEEINLNSSLFKVIGPESEDKELCAGEMEDDRKTPSPLPPPLPSSPPPIVSKPSPDLPPT